MNKDRLLDIFSKIHKEDKPNNFHYNSRVLIIDGMNTFLRSFAVVERMNLLGHHVGGLVGFLRSIGAAIKLLHPTRVIIVFDGEAGSANRKYLYSGYKSSRDNQRIVNFKSFTDKGEEDSAKYDQASRLVDYLEFLPVTCIALDRLEADDIIGHLTKQIYEGYTDSETYVMSSDKDFMQLVNDRVKVYSPSKKKIYHVDSVVEEFGVHPNNFLLFKTLIGDSSDDIPGVNGFGEKNTLKLFDFMADAEARSLEQLYEACENPKQKSVLYSRVLNTKKMVEIFYKIMNLKEPNISNSDLEEIGTQLYQKPKALRRFDFIKLYQHDRMGDVIPNIDTWLNLFSTLDSYK